MAHSDPSQAGPRRLRWGILGAAEIARKNFKAIYNSENSVVAGVASRDPKRCRSFIEACQSETPGHPAPKAFVRYEDLLASPEIDAVYIPLPTGRRKEWVLRAASAGKHVLCEKPCATSVADLVEMLDACRRNRVQFMDGVMFTHSRRLDRMREALAGDAPIGKLRRITSAFSFLAPPDFAATNIRGKHELEPQGCLGDLGWYCIRLSLWAMNWQMPSQVTGRTHSELRAPGRSAPVPAEFSGELLYEGGVSASFYCSFLTENQQWAILSGEHGFLQILDFVLPFAGPELSFDVLNSNYSMEGCNFSMDPGSRRVSTPEWSHGHANAQESNLFRNFANQALSGKLNDGWAEEALKTQQITCACLESASKDSRPVALG